MKTVSKNQYIKQLEEKIKLLEEANRFNELNLLKEKIRNSLLLKMIVKEKRKHYLSNMQ